MGPAACQGKVCVQAQLQVISQIAEQQDKPVVNAGLQYLPGLFRPPQLRVGHGLYGFRRTGRPPILSQKGESLLGTL